MASKDFRSFSADALTNKIDAGLPVILAGSNEIEESCFLNWCWATGHAWLCEGYRRSTFCETGSTHLLLLMNWGWAGWRDNWFGLDHWNPNDERHYNLNREMVVNIRP